MCRASPQMCPKPAPLRAHERQISEIRLVAMIIAQDLNLLLRSTARIGSTCVPKQPYDNAGKRDGSTAPGSIQYSGLLHNSGSLRVDPHGDFCPAYGLFRQRQYPRAALG